MPAALITLIQTALLQQQKFSPTSANEKPDKASVAGEKSGTSLATKGRFDVVASGRPAPSSAGAPQSSEECGGYLGALLQEVVMVAQELAQTDSMLAEARTSAPEDEEAQKWHEVSLRALLWSRETLAERQTAAIARMKAAIERPAMLPIEGRSEPEAECAPTETPREQVATPVTPHIGTSPVGSLRADLEKLRTYDPDRCLLVRNLKTLGLSSHQRLQEHFGLYGAVSEVLVAHSFEKPSAKRRYGRIRSATKGFVVMEETAAALAVLEAGGTHAVADGDELHEVAVQPFNPLLVEDCP